MWHYQDISREEFEQVKDRIEEIMLAHGAVVFDAELPYMQKTTSMIGKDNEIVWEGQRKTYQYRDLYYRIDEVCFEKAPCIVPTVGTYEELMNNIMDDMDTIPYNLTEEELEDEVSYFLGEKPYPRR